MANHRLEGREAVHHNPTDPFIWPVIVPLSVGTWPVWPWAGWLWEHAPTPTALYMAISAAFMLFQMSDKLGWLDRLKRRRKYDSYDNPEN